MSVQSTTTAKQAEPPKQSAQPWVPTGLTYYHNQYVQRAADLGCCGITQLLIFEDSSLPAIVAKIAAFVIASIGFAIYDVLHAVWETITCSRNVAAIPAAPANNKAPNTNPSSATSTEDPAKSKSSKNTGTTNDDEDDFVDLSQLSTEFNLEDPPAVAATITANLELLAKASEQLRGEIAKRPESFVTRNAVDHLSTQLNKQSSAIAVRLTHDGRIIRGLEDTVQKMTKQSETLNRQMGDVMKIAKELDPRLAAQIDAIGKSESKGKKPSAKGAPTSDAAKPEEGAKARKHVSEKSEPVAPKTGKGHAPKDEERSDSEEEGVPPPSVSSHTASASMQPGSHLTLEQTYQALRTETYQIGLKLRISEHDLEIKCDPIGKPTYESEIERLSALKGQWTGDLLTSYASILAEINGIGNINTKQMLNNINKTHPDYDKRLPYFEDQVYKLLPAAINILLGMIEERVNKLGLNIHDFKTQEQKIANPVERLKWLKGVIPHLNGLIAKEKAKLAAPTAAAAPTAGTTPPDPTAAAPVPTPAAPSTASVPAS